MGAVHRSCLDRRNLRIPSQADAFIPAMKRTARVKIEYVVEMDDEGMGTPHVNVEAISEITRMITPEAAYVPQTGRASVSFTRESSFAVRRAAKEKQA